MERWNGGILPQCVVGRVDPSRAVTPERDVLLQVGRQIKTVKDVFVAQMGCGEVPSAALRACPEPVEGAGFVSGGGKNPQPVVQSDNFRPDGSDVDIAALPRIPSSSNSRRAIALCP
jgi:hypothetical protein